MSAPKATVLIPTSIDRGPLLPYSVGSVLNQTVRDLEVFIIGDGVQEVTRRVARDLEKQDSRVRFFDFPKGPSRGEIHRHVALREARGETVCYLCDRDLMLPDHVATQMDLLRDADFATTQLLVINEDQVAGSKPALFDAGRDEDRRYLASKAGFPLSSFGHRLELYRRLPLGWQTTPPGLLTDHYMCRLLLGVPGCRARTAFKPTILYFHRGLHPGLSSPERAAELADWFPRLGTPGGLQSSLRESCGATLGTIAGLQSRLRSPLLLGGLTPWEFCQRVGRKVASLRGKRKAP